MRDYPKPIITADIIVCRVAMPLDILLIQRGKEPFIDQWALAGGHFDILTDPSIEFAAHRELSEELSITSQILTFFRHYDQMGRDPRGRYVTFVYSCCLDKGAVAKAQAADDAKECKWFPLSKILDEKIPLAFDHQQIIVDWYRSLNSWDNK